MTDLAIILGQSLLLLVLVLASAFFSGAETALFALGRARLLQYAEDPRPERRRIAELMRTYHHTLISLVGGNMLVNTGISVVLAGLLAGLALQPWQTTALAVFITVVVLLVFGEITPKAVCLQYAERVVAWLAPAVWWWRTLLMPVIRLVDHATARLLDLLGRRQSPPLREDEYGDYVELAYSIGAFNETEAGLLKDVFSLRRCRVNRVMIPRPDVPCLSCQLPAAAVTEAIRRHARRFLPVVRDNLDEVESILSVRDFFALPPEAREHWAESSAVSPAAFVPENASLMRTLAVMTSRGLAVAMVADEYGGVVGMIERKRIFEEIVGDLADDYGPPSWQLRRDGPDAWLVNGQMPLDELRELLPELPAFPPEAHTLSGLFSLLLDRLPQPGDRCVFAGLELTAIAVARNRVVQARLQRPVATVTGEGDS